ncbi:TPA: sel1 repeat family protein [Neisseria meningitidis]
MKQTAKWLAAALIALGLNQAVWADGVPNFQKTLQAAEQGNAQAQSDLGAMYYKGRGVRQDLVLAQEWLGKACQNGDQDGCDNDQRLKAGY